MCHTSLLFEIKSIYLVSFIYSYSLSAGLQEMPLTSVSRALPSIHIDNDAGNSVYFPTLLQCVPSIVNLYLCFKTDVKNAMKNIETNNIHERCKY